MWGGRIGLATIDRIDCLTSLDRFLEIISRREAYPGQISLHALTALLVTTFLAAFSRSVNGGVIGKYSI